MQSLSEFRAAWKPAIAQQSTDVSAKIESRGNMLRFLQIEPEHRAAVDALVLEYSSALSVASGNLTSLDLGYLFHIRIHQAYELAMFFEDWFQDTEMTAREWILFFGVECWHEFGVYRWQNAFQTWYGPSGPGASKA